MVLVGRSFSAGRTVFNVKELFILDTKLFVQHFWKISSFWKMELTNIFHQVKKDQSVYNCRIHPEM